MDEIPNLWNDRDCAALTEPELLRYRSNLLGADRRITNFGGGNTSAKVSMPDPLTGREVDVLWVKGSGGDLGSIRSDGFATLYLDKVLALEERYRGPEHEDEMAGCLELCTFASNPRPASIDTALHAFLPAKHADHLHPDCVIAIAAARRSEELTREVFGGEIGWLPWQRPGFDLGLRLRRLERAESGIRGVVLAGHGLVTWGETAKECYETSLRTIHRAQAWIEDVAGRRPAPFGAAAVAPEPAAARADLLADLLPVLRGRLGAGGRKVGHVVDTDEVLAFVGSERVADLAGQGTSCPDHFLRTKVRPLLLDPGGGPEIDAKIRRYHDDYAAYYERCRHADSPPMRDPDPVVILVPGAGLVTFAATKSAARRAAECWVSAIRVMRGASLLDDYVGLPEQEAFDIEYWRLEDDKLRRMPAEKTLSRRIALVTGAAGAIGKAVARRLLAEQACVVLADADTRGLDASRDDLAGAFDADLVRGVGCDVTDPAAVRRTLRFTVAEFGGLDVLVCCTGLASSAAIEDTTLADWERNLEVLATGYFLAAREAFRVLRAQGTGGSIVFVGSKNALQASPRAAAYCTAKAAALHLARCLALEGAEHGIRVNTVNPDAVLGGSKIWDGDWRRARAAAYGIAEDELEEHYRRRSLLGLEVRAEDVADTVWFFASDLSSRSTGNILNVDAGNAGSFPR